MDSALMMTTASIRSTDGTELHVRLWPGTRPRGRLVISHGLGEHAGCYDHVAEALSAVDGLVDVLAFDYRGHGRSAGGRGVVRHYNDLAADLQCAIAAARSAWPGDRPLYLLGHSNGGQVALHVVAERSTPVAGLILSNPLLALAARIPAWKVAFGRVMRRLAPGVTLSANLGAESMTRDPANWAERRNDPLRHNRINAPFFFGMIDGGARLIAAAHAITVPCLLLLGGADRVVDPGATRRFFEAIGSTDKTLRFEPEMRHEPLNEVGRQQVLDSVIAWLEARLPAAPDSA